MRSALVLLLSTVVACSSAEPNKQPAVPGVVVDNCADTELPILGGGCRKVGARDCGPGFTLDEERGCSPILPAARCEKGTMAVPGDASCRSVSASCGDGKWGTIPTAAGAVFVDGSYTGSDSDGSESKPFRTIQAGITAATPGYVVAVAEGTYNENLEINRRVKLWGRCAEKVAIVGTATFTLDVTVESEVHDVAVTGADTAIGVASANVVIDGVRIYDAGSRGLDIENLGGVATVTMRNSLIEGTGQIGVYVEGSTLTLERSVVRGTHAGNAGESTNGILVRAAEVTGRPSNLRMIASVVDDNNVFGVNIANSIAAIDGSVIRGTKRSTKSPAAGLTVQKISAAAPELKLTRTFFDAHEGVAIDVSRANATIDTVTIRDLVADGGGGMLVENATGTLTNTTLVDLGPTGINVTSSVFEITRSRVARLLPDPSGMMGPGLQVDSDHGYPSEVTASELLFRDLHAAAIGIFGSRFTLSESAIISVRPMQNDVFGDGIALASVGWRTGETDIVEATITRTIVRDAARASVAVFGGNVHIGDSFFCSPIDIDAEKTYGRTDDGTMLQRDFAVEDLTGNVCGCGTPGRCIARSSGLLPMDR